MFKQRSSAIWGMLAIVALFLVTVSPVALAQDWSFNVAENVVHQVKIGLSYLSTILAKQKGPRSFSATHALIIRSFVESIFGNGDPLITPEMGYENVRIVEQICRQIEKTRVSRN